MVNYEQILSARVKEVQPSGIRRFFELAAKMPHAISLGVGEPDFETPWQIRRAGIQPEYMRYSYVGQELFESYLEASHIKEYEILANLVPKEPY